MTQDRYDRIRSVLNHRQTDLTVCMEEVHKPHNVSAVIRSCDAIGIHKVHAVWDYNDNLREDQVMRTGTSMGSHVWVKAQYHDTIEDAVTCFKQQDMQVLVTHLDDSAVDFREIDYTKPTAILLGQEKRGATTQAIDSADQAVVIPMVGMVQSLNVSVAAAIMLYEAQRQRQLAGMYETCSLDEQTCQTILFQGGFPLLYDACLRKNLPFPYINEIGEIIAEDAWWQALKIA